MELGLALEDEDFVAKDDQEDNLTLSYQAKKCSRNWFCKQELENPTDLKFRADHAYARKYYLEAIEIYQVILTETSGKALSVRRDILESLSRSYLHLEQREQAYKYAIELLEISHPSNTDHMTVCHSLLALTAATRLQEISHLTVCINTHPFVPELWLRVGRAYESMDDSERHNLPLSKSFDKEIIYFCQMRAFILLQTVEKSVKSFAQAKNLNLQNKLQKAMNEVKLAEHDRERVQLYASLDIFQRKADTGSGSSKNDHEEFIDLGSSKNRAREEDFSPRNLQSHENDDQTLILKRVIDFEKNWFLFLVQ